MEGGRADVINSLQKTSNTPPMAVGGGEARCAKWNGGGSPSN